MIGFWQWQRPEAANFAGLWEAQVHYSWDGSFNEAFDFKADGNKWFGTASFLGVKRGIHGGRISAGQITFSVRFQSMSGSQ